MGNSNQTERRLLASIRKAKSSSQPADSAAAAGGSVPPAAGAARAPTRTGSGPRTAPGAAKPKPGSAIRRGEIAAAPGDYQFGRRVWPE